MRPHTRQAWTGLGFVLPSAAGVAVFTLLPLLYSLRYTVLRGAGASAHFVGWANIIDLAHSQAFWTGFTNTLSMSGLGVVLLMAVSLSSAVVLARAFAGSAWLRTASLLPYVLPTAAVVGICEWALSSRAAPDGAWAYWLLIVIFLVKNTGYVTLIFTAGLANIPVDLVQAAQLDGASDRQAFFYIKLPLLKPAGYFALVISIINSFQLYRESYYLFGNYPPMSVYTMQNFMNNNFANLAYQRLSVASLALLIVLSIVVLGLQRLGNVVDT